MQDALDTPSRAANRERCAWYSMSALGQKQHAQSNYIRFTPNSGHWFQLFGLW